MSPFLIGAIGLGILLLLLFLGVHIGIAMALVGVVGFIFLTTLGAGLNLTGTVPWRTTASYSLSVIPLFIWMGYIVFYSGMGSDLYNAGYKWFGAQPGGLALGTVVASAGFGAVCGSSVAAVATMGTVVLPEMKKYNYSPGLATGCICAGGGLSFVIPPSLTFILYGIITEQSIGKLFVSGILPGVLLTFLFGITIYLMVRINPKIGPRGPRTSFGEKMESVKYIWPVAILFALVVGGLYVGIFTPTEAGGVGAFGALIIGLSTRRLRWGAIRSSLLEAAETTGMSYFILIGAIIFNYFIAMTRFPMELAELVGSFGWNEYLVITAIAVIYLILGCVMDMFALLLLMVPIFFPLVTGIGFDPIWFGVVTILLMNQAEITPPVGVNVYVMSAVAKDVPMFTIFRGVLPFWVDIMVCVVIVIAFPQIALFLPNLIS